MAAIAGYDVDKVRYVDFDLATELDHDLDHDLDLDLAHDRTLDLSTELVLFPMHQCRLQKTDLRVGVRLSDFLHSASAPQTAERELAVEKQPFHERCQPSR